MKLLSLRHPMLGVLSISLCSLALMLGAADPAVADETPTKPESTTTDLSRTAHPDMQSVKALSDFVESQRWNLLPVPSEMPTPRKLAARYNRWCVDRVATRFAGRGTGQARARAAAVLLLALRGTPFLYQGEELGLADTAIEPEKVVDLDGRDGVRTPLPWASPAAAGPGAGFTTGDPWLPVASEAAHSSIAAQRADPDSTLSLYRRLLALRRLSPALQSGSYEPLDAPDGIFAFAREQDDQRLLVAVNFGSRAVDLPADSYAGSLVLSSVADRSARLSARTVLPDEAVILLPSRP